MKSYNNLLSKNQTKQNAQKFKETICCMQIYTIRLLDINNKIDVIL